MKIEYEQRVVVFIDILGFKNLVNNSDSDSTFIKMILNALNILKEEKSNLKWKKVSLFSDNLIISYSINEKAITYLLKDLSKLTWELLQIGVLVRGGITIENIFHKDDIVFGKALNEAYFLESELAIYPRIILTDSTYDKFTNILKSNELSIKSLLSKDIDGFYYFDIFLAAKEFENKNTYPEYLKKVEDLINSNIDIKNDKLNQKYLWLENKLCEIK